MVCRCLPANQARIACGGFPAKLKFEQARPLVFQIMIAFFMIIPYNETNLKNRER